MQTAQQVWHGHTLTYGLAGGDVRGALIDLDMLEVDGLRFHLPLPGQHNALNFLAALTVGPRGRTRWPAPVALPTIDVNVNVNQQAGRRAAPPLPEESRCPS
jgi:UDP-N-acetylmuramoyl-tripeptide--D-alanyl-D-alanine ligase